MIPPGSYACSICAKGFDNRTSQVRHISYCRKSKSRGRSRKKACLACTKAKTHCDLASPGCSRCASKNLACHYDGPRRPSSAGTAVEVSSSSGGGIPLGEISILPLENSSKTGVELIQDGQNGAGIPLTSCLEQRGSGSAFSTMYDMSFEDLISSQNIREPLQLSYLDATTRATGPLDPAGEGVFTFNQLLPKPPRAFFPRAVREHHVSLNRKYMMATLRSYPFALAAGKSQKLPAFVHPQCLCYGSKNDFVVRQSRSSPLENCVAIVQMWSVKNKANSAFIWNTIRSEQERLFSECSQYDDWTTVAGLQAVTMYCLLRVVEQDDELMNFDLPLIRTMIKFAQHTYGISLRNSVSPDGGSPSWEAWILVECLRRTLTVLFLINMLFDYSSLLYPHVCDDSELLHIALPSGRDLWQARSRHEWEREYAISAVGKQLTFGDLVNSRFRADRTLDPWLEQLDDFGMLVMAAASLGDG